MTSERACLRPRAAIEVSLREDSWMFDSSLTSSPLRWSQLSQSQTWSPPTDVYETDTSIVVKIEIAGLRPERAQIFKAPRSSDWAVVVQRISESN